MAVSFWLYVADAHKQTYTQKRSTRICLEAEKKKHDVNRDVFFFFYFSLSHRKAMNCRTSMLLSRNYIICILKNFWPFVTRASKQKKRWVFSLFWIWCVSESKKKYTDGVDLILILIAWHWTFCRFGHRSSFSEEGSCKSGTQHTIMCICMCNLANWQF